MACKHADYIAPTVGHAITAPPEVTGRNRTNNRNEHSSNSSRYKLVTTAAQSMHEHISSCMKTVFHQCYLNMHVMYSS